MYFTQRPSPARRRRPGRAGRSAASPPSRSWPASPPPHAAPIPFTQHLVDGPLTIGALAERLEVTQQAASKSVVDLERRAYVARKPDPGDARARLVALTERGHAVIEGGRRHREAIAAELGDRLGTRRVESARRLLNDLVAELGAEVAIRGRSVRAPR